MRVAIDVSPLSSGHSLRGVGFYLRHLKDALVNFESGNEYVFFDNLSEVPADVDIVHFPYFDPYLPTLPAKNPEKTVVTVHDLTTVKFSKHFPPGIKGRLRWQIQKNRLKRVAGIITDSDSSKDDVAKIAGVSSEKISRVYLAASEEFKKQDDPEARKKVIKKYSLPDNFILYVGDATWNKNLPRVVDAVKASGQHLVLVGKAIADKAIDQNNPWNKDLVQVQKLIEGDTNFHPLGFVSDEELNALYNCGQFLVMPSIYEGFGLPVIEAMQAGLPVLTSKEGSLEEVGADAVFYVDPFSTISIKEGIEKLKNDDNLRLELSEKGIRRAREFSWKKTAKETVKAYEKALK